MRSFAPFGVERPTRLDAGEPAEPLGRWSPDRLAELAGQLDCVLIGGGEIIHNHYGTFTNIYTAPGEEIEARDPARFFWEGVGRDLESECPTAWNAVSVPFDPDPQEASRLRAALAGRAYVAVRDEQSKRRLEAAGVEREILVVPDSAVLLPRLFEPAKLRTRLQALRALGWYPGEGPTIVVQGSRLLIPHVQELAAALRAVLHERPDHTLVSVQTGPCHGDDAFVEALGSALPELRFRLPAEVGLDDVAAVIAASDGFVGISLHGNLTAYAYGRAHVALNLLGYSKLDGFAQSVDRLECVVTEAGRVPAALAAVAARPVEPAALAARQRKVDDHFDAVAQLAAESVRRRPERDGESRLSCRLASAEQRLAVLLQARGDHRERLRRERLAFADHMGAVGGSLRELSDAVARLEDELGTARAAEAGAHRVSAELAAELGRLQRTRTLRYTARMRDFYQRLRTARRNGQPG